MFMSENSLLISEIHLIISLHFSFVKKQRTETSKMIVRYVKVIFFCFNIKYSMVSLSTCYDESVIHYAPHRTEHASFLTNISQGSVATHSRCGGIVNDCCAANFLGIVTVEEFLKSANIWRSYV